VLRLSTHLVLMEAGKTVAQGNLSEMSLHPRVRAIIGSDAVGAIVDGTVLGKDPSSGLTRVQVGQGELKVQFGEAIPGTRLRVQLLARDLIVATEPPRQISVRNSLPGVIVSVANDVDDSDLIAIDIGGTLIMARVTNAATRELSLAPGKSVWALVKTASLRPHVI
jgi:molybdate transport system ATP-binding protein